MKFVIQMKFHLIFLFVIFYFWRHTIHPQKRCDTENGAAYKMFFMGLKICVLCPLYCTRPRFFLPWFFLATRCIPWPSNTIVAVSLDNETGWQVPVTSSLHDGCSSLASGCRRFFVKQRTRADKAKFHYFDLLWIHRTTSLRHSMWKVWAYFEDLLSGCQVWISCRLLRQLVMRPA